MSRTPAALIAKLKVEYPQWQIRSALSGSGYTARHRDSRALIHASSAEGLEIVLAEMKPLIRARS